MKIKNNKLFTYANKLNEIKLINIDREIKIFIHFMIVIIFFLITQVSAVLIGLEYLDGNLTIQLINLSISNFIYYKVMTSLNLL